MELLLIGVGLLITGIIVSDLAEIGKKLDKINDRLLEILHK
jgi:hypothetical protein